MLQINETWRTRELDVNNIVLEKYEMVEGRIQGVKNGNNRFEWVVQGYYANILTALKSYLIVGLNIEEEDTKIEHLINQLNTMYSNLEKILKGEK